MSNNKVYQSIDRTINEEGKYVYVPYFYVTIILSAEGKKKKGVIKLMKRYKINR